eukprot:1374445-Prymnesium_polylepis.2
MGSRKSSWSPYLYLGRLENELGRGITFHTLERIARFAHVGHPPMMWVHIVPVLGPQQMDATVGGLAMDRHRAVPGVHRVAALVHDDKCLLCRGECIQI